MPWLASASSNLGRHPVLHWVHEARFGLQCLHAERMQSLGYQDKAAGHKLTK